MRSRRLARLAAVLLLLAGSALLASRLTGGSGSAGELTVGEPSEALEEARGARAAPAPSAGGLWITRAAAPLPAPGSHQAVWTGDALVAWGGDGEASAYDLRDRRWRPLGPAPAGPLLGPVLAWTGDETLVWGGQRPEGGWATGGAAVDHRDGTWRELPEAPAAISRPAAAWTGEELLVWGAGAVAATGGEGAAEAGGGAGEALGLALDPEEGRWRRLEPAPVRSVERAAAAWTGRELLVWGHGRGGETFALAYTPRGSGSPGRWRRLAPPPLSNPARAAAAWTGQDGRGELVLWGRQLAGQRGSASPAGAALDPEADRWRLLPPAPGYDWTGSGWGVQGLRAAWTGERVMIVGGYPSSVTLAYDPRADSWSTLPDLAGVIDPVLEWTGPFVSSTGVPRRGELLLWGGYGPFGPTVDLRSWRTVGIGPTGDARLNTVP